MKHYLRDLLKVCALLTGICFGLPVQAQMYASGDIAITQKSERSTTVQLDSEKRWLTKILFTLEDDYHVSFNYDHEMIRNIYLDKDFSWNKKEKLEKVLERLLTQVELKFERLDKKNYLILNKGKNSDPGKESKSPEHPGESSIRRTEEAQHARMSIDFPVSGYVREETGAGLPGVNILVKGTTSGTTTDANGFYKLEAPDANAILVFTFVGFVPQEVAINNRSSLDVVLQADVQSLQEVVVMGYNTQEKRDVTGSVVTVKAEDLKSVPASNFANQLQGRAAGVVVSNDNTPGGGVAVRIRGIGSITGNNEPLYVIDGVPTTGSNLNQLNSNDIETMQVLKDASAASIYGARANNGVIVITTKKGKAGVTKVNYSMYEGVQVPGKAPDVLNSQQLVDIIWADYKSRGLVNPVTGNLTVPDPRFGGGPRGVIPDYILSDGTGVNLGDAPIGNDPMAAYTFDPSTPGFGSTKFMIYQPDKNGFDWYDAVYDPAPIRNHNLSITGGSETGRFAVSADYFQQNGIVIHNSFKRYSIRANTEFTIKETVRFGENIQLSYTDNVGIPNARTEFSPVGGVGTPFIVPYDIAGNYVGSRLGDDHALTLLERNKDNHDYNTRIFGNLYLEADIFKVITARTSIGLDYNIRDAQTFNPKSPESDLRSQQDVLNFGWSKGQSLTWTNTLNYRQDFDDHTIQFLAGTEAVTSQYRNVGGEKSNFAFDDNPSRFLDAGTVINSLGGGGAESSLFSIFGKVDYKFRNRYLLSATLRRDASSRFSPSNRWGTFPAFSMGWIISEEEFMQSVPFISSLKLIGGWGVTGSQDIDEYNQYTTFAYSNSSSAYPINGGISGAGSLVTGFEARRIGNPNAQWEEQSMTNIGVDLILFDRLSFTVELYNRKTSKLLLIVPAPAIGGANQAAAANVGEVSNKGIDLALNYEGSMDNGLKYGIGVNWSAYRNSVTSLYDATNPFIPGPTIRQQVFTRTQVGQPLSSFFGMINEGVFHSQEEADAHPTQFGNRSLYNQPGRLKYRDYNNDGVINGSDVTFIGNPHPDFTYGVNLTAGYKGFDLTLFLFGVYGNDIYNFKRQGSDLMLFESNKSTRILDYWTPENSDSNVPTPNSAASSEEYYRTSTYFVEKGSYLRAKNMQIGYNVPAKWTSRIGVDNLRLYLQGSNLFTITNYTGRDPEINLLNYNQRGNEIDRGVDRGVYPAAKVFMIGAQIGF